MPNYGYALGTHAEVFSALGAYDACARARRCEFFLETTCRACKYTEHLTAQSFVPLMELMYERYIAGGYYFSVGVEPLDRSDFFSIFLVTRGQFCLQAQPRFGVVKSKFFYPAGKLFIEIPDYPGFRPRPPLKCGRCDGKLDHV